MNKKRLTLIGLLLHILTASLHAQSLGAVAGNPSADNPQPGKTWAVVIGISKYENKNIQNLTYADRDARTFYDYLVNTEGGPELKPSQVKLLLNENAATTNIHEALEWLGLSAKENDRVLFYFAGHGDVDQETIYQNGFLMPYNSNPADYISSGAIDVNFLQQEFETYIVKNRARDAVLIIDACLSGKLSGKSDGAQLIMNALGKPWNNQIIKLLSAQENESSLEGTAWGGGVFFYYLMKGIEGLADLNNDNIITTNELNVYLSINVPKATEYHQTPAITGNPRQQLFTFNQKLLSQAKLDVRPLQQTPQIAYRAMDDDLTASIQIRYKKYLDYVKQGRLLWGSNETDTLNCARHFYFQLIGKPGAEAIQASLKSSFLAALQQKTQEFLDRYVTGKKFGLDNYEAFQEISFAKQLIKPEDALYNYVTARAYYMQSNYEKNKETAVTLLRNILQIEKDAPYALNELGGVYMNMGIADSAIYYFQKAASVSQRWAFPVINLGTVYLNLKKDLNKASSYFKKAIELDNTSAVAYNNLGSAFLYQKDTVTAILHYERSIQLDSTLALAYCNLGAVIYSKDTLKALSILQKAVRLDTSLAMSYNNLGIVYLAIRDTDKATWDFQKAIQLDSTITLSYNNLGAIYENKQKTDLAINYFQKAIQIDPNFSMAYVNLGGIYSVKKAYEKAILYFKEAVLISPSNADFYDYLGMAYAYNKEYKNGIDNLMKALYWMPNDNELYYDLACIYSLKNDTYWASVYLNSALRLGFKDYDHIMDDDDLVNLRKSDRFNQLIRMYFPDKVR